MSDFAEISDAIVKRKLITRKETIMFIKGMNRADYERLYGETNEDIEDILDGLDEAPINLYGDEFEDREDD